MQTRIMDLMNGLKIMLWIHVIGLNTCDRSTFVPRGSDTKEYRSVHNTWAGEREQGNVRGTQRTSSLRTEIVCNPNPYNPNHKFRLCSDLRLLPHYMYPCTPPSPSFVLYVCSVWDRSSTGSLCNCWVDEKVFESWSGNCGSLVVHVGICSWLIGILEWFLVMLASLSDPWLRPCQRIRSLKQYYKEEGA